MNPARTTPALYPTARQTIASFASDAIVHKAFNWLQAEERRFREWQMEFTAIPAPPFGEAQRSRWLNERFKKLGLADVAIDEVGNVIGFRSGTQKSELALAITAHIDTVFPPGTRIEVRREGEKLLGPGISDNASGVTAVLAMAAVLAEFGMQTQAPLLFVGNVGEEGEGDLRGMRHLFSKSPWKDSIARTLVVDGAGTETIVTQALGSRRFEVTARAKGGHSWSDFSEPNPIVVLARAIDALYQIPASGEADVKSAYNVGVIDGGTSVNSIPSKASMRIDLRSSSQAEIERLSHELNRVVAAAAQNGRLSAGPAGESSTKVRVSVDKIGERPAAELSGGARILQIVRAVDEHLGINSRLHRSSTDANIPLSLGREAVSLGAGGIGGGAHTLNEWFDTTGRDLGLKRILLAILALGNEPAPARQRDGITQ
ncbi:MAG: M20/M25/M40 family metallo-hydrolase [Acidobacteriales bacterium]|nr:M20/M25/M40 family metallo-hydrolase [Terriglobales bacterium]